METTVKCDCQYKSNCKYVEKLHAAILQAKDENALVAEIKEIVIIKSDKSFYNSKIFHSPIFSTHASFEVSCKFLKTRSLDALKKLIIQHISGDLESFSPVMNNDEEDENEKDEYSNTDNLTRAKMRLESVREIKYPIEIVANTDINAFALDEGKIQITSAAVEDLSEAELAFLIAHEEAHIDRHHGLKKNFFSNFFKAGIRQIAKTEQLGTLKKIVSMIAAETAAIAALPLIEKGHEIGADIVAKKRMIEAGYSEEETTRFFDRLGSRQGKYFTTHPTPQFRKKIIEE